MDELTKEVQALEVATPRRSVRKRVFSEPPQTSFSPKKRKSFPTQLTEEKLKKFYMNKTSAKVARHALETIYEEGHKLGVQKVKRSIVMGEGIATKTKKLERRKKIKRLGMKAVKVKKLSDEEFKKRLGLIDALLLEGKEHKLEFLKK